MAPADTGLVSDSVYGRVAGLRDLLSPGVRVAAQALPAAEVRPAGERLVAVIAGTEYEIECVGGRRGRVALRCRVGELSYLVQPGRSGSAHVVRDRQLIADVRRSRSGERSLVWLTPAAVHPTEAALVHAMVALEDVPDLLPPAT